MWQVTAYRHMICISLLCAISCLTHIYSVHVSLNTTHPHHIYLIFYKSELLIYTQIQFLTAQFLPAQEYMEDFEKSI